jgi:MATE family multidrug resistance protein
MLFFSGSILDALGFDATVTPKSQGYLRICIWGIFPLMVIDTIRRWLEAQGIAYISMGVSFFGFILCWPLNQLLVRNMGYGAVGSAYTFNIVNWLTAAVMILYCYFSKVYVKTLAVDKFNLKELLEPKQLWNYLKYALPATGTMFSEFFGFEVQAVIAARISKHAVAGQLLIFALNGFLYHIPLSYGVAAATRVGHLLGGKRGQQAKDAFVVLLQLTTLTEIIIAVLLLLLSNTMPRWFTDDENVLEIVTSVIPLLAIFSIFNGNQVSMGGVLRGQGAMRFQFITNVLCYWALAIPLGYYLALFASEHTYINDDGEKVTGAGIGVLGQWMALGLASFLIQIIYFFYLFYLDWDNLADRVHAKTHKNANTNLGDHSAIGEGEGLEMGQASDEYGSQPVTGQYAQYQDSEVTVGGNTNNNDPFNYPVSK